MGFVDYSQKKKKKRFELNSLGLNGRLAGEVAEISASSSEMKWAKCPQKAGEQVYRHAAKILHVYTNRV